jgi:hypothetical protein
MATIHEDRQRLDFDPTWAVSKWDIASEFTDGLGSATPGVKAADVVGVRASRPRAVLVAEFKDFTNPRIPAHELAQASRKAESPALLDDLVKKVIDTLGGATFAHDGKNERKEALLAWRSAVARPTTKILILVCLEVPKPAIVNALSAALRQRLGWLGPNATVLVTAAVTPLVDLGISYRV